jgi:hypothetical protein
MNMVKALLVGSAAALTGFAAQAADLPRKSAPAEFVRVCVGQGAGFFVIPGTDTCIRIGGMVRASYMAGASSSGVGATAVYGAGGALAVAAGVAPGFLNAAVVAAPGAAGAGLTAPALPAGTSTGVGTGVGQAYAANSAANGVAYLNTLTSAGLYGQNQYGMGAELFLNIDARTNTSMGLVRTYARILGAHGAAGLDKNSGVAPGSMNVLEAFVQFAGITAGYNLGNFDFYRNDYNISGRKIAGSTDTRNLQLAYTAALGNGITATIALEDGAYRRTPASAAALANSGLGNVNPALNAAAFVATTGAVANVSNPVIGNSNTAITGALVGANKMPDIVANLNVTQAWGSAQLMGAIHDVRAVNGASATGYALGAGVKIAVGSAGSELMLTGVMSNGALSYHIQGMSSGYLGNAVTANGPGSFADAYVNDAANGINTTKAMSLIGGYKHVWNSQFTTALVAGYQMVDQPNGTAFGGTVAATTVTPIYDYKTLSLAMNNTWTPVAGLAVGLEFMYERTNVGQNGAAFAPGSAPTAITLPTGFGTTSTTVNVPASQYNNFGTHLRITRAF